ncbi:MAG: hypothetical protein HKN09_11395 [Saprospiraceae bacterium]|nr:hypothetical protein [Saprospiraceae bacterium]
MKILYGIQGTGNGHLSRASVLAPYLVQHAEIDFLISGKSSEVQFPYTFKYRRHGIFFYFGNKGGPEYFKSIASLRPFRFLHDIYALPIEEYDWIISDFEPISAWAAKQKKVNCLELSHHAAFRSDAVPRPESVSRFFEWGMRNFAPGTDSLGVHYKSYDHNIVTPIIRKSLLKCQTSSENHVTVYLPAYSDKKLINCFAQIKEVNWRIFSKKTDHTYSYGHITIHPVSQKNYNESIISAQGMILAAGFQATSEALYLKKKMLVVPMKAQYEQTCNAVALKRLGVKILADINEGAVDEIRHWLNSTQSIESLDFMSHSEIIERVLSILKV